MFKWLSTPWNKPALESFDGTITRERLIQTGRILFIDDESPLLINELRQEAFAVDHDTVGNDLHKLENQVYDVLILDYHGVGQRFGGALDILKYVRRVAPRTRIIAYTSRSLSASESEFFRQSNAVLPKDLGLGDSLALIEGELRKALEKEHLFDALVQKLKISDSSERERLKNALISSLAKKNESFFSEQLKKITGKVTEKGADVIISRLFTYISPGS